MTADPTVTPVGTEPAGTAAERGVGSCPVVGDDAAGVTASAVGAVLRSRAGSG